MPHIHDQIDFTVAAYVVFQNKILLVHHKKLQKWLPPGGHIELNQDPQEALFAELQEETGITKEQLEIIGNKPTISSPGTKFLYAPIFLDIHDISETHKHIGMTYILKSKTDTIQLSHREHNQIRWFSMTDIANPEYKILPAVQFYSQEALRLTERL